MNRVILVRHGENLANLTLQFSHRLVDFSLTSKGVLQAQQTAEFLREQGIQEIYSSPLKRAHETASIIAGPLGLPVTVLENFREVNVGELEAQPPTPENWKLHNSIIEAWFDGHPEMRFPGGEDLFTLVARVRAGFEQVLAGKTGRTILISAHGGIITFGLRALVAGMERTSQPMPNCSLSELEAGIVDGKLDIHLLSFATAGHLSGEAARLVSGLPEETKEGAAS